VIDLVNANSAPQVVPSTNGPRAAGRNGPADLESIELPLIPLLPPVVERGVARKPPLSERVRSALAQPDLDAFLKRRPELEDDLVSSAESLARRAYPRRKTTALQSDPWIDHSARAEMHRTLLAVYQQHVRLPVSEAVSNQFHPLACRLMRVLEEPWERDMLRRARRYDLSLASLPADPAEFSSWYRDTAFSHPLYEHDLYTFVASNATRDQLEWFFRMECAGEAAFDDLVALAQVGTRGEVKIEMASNYWDEMGRGKSHAVHTHLFHRLIEGLELEAPEASELPWQVLAGVNVMLWSCIPRRNAFRAQGVLGAVELLAPQRCTRVVHGALRVGMRKKTVVYYGAHAIIDVGHAEGWLAHVVEPQVRAIPESRLGIAEGLILRADASLDYFDYCLAHARALAA
jgi:heme oxygenase-like protein